MMDQQRVPLRQRRELGLIVNDAFTVYSRYFPAFFSIAMVVIPLGVASGIFADRIKDDAVEAGVVAVIDIGQLLVSLLAAAALLAALVEVDAGRLPDFGKAYDEAFARIGTLVGGMLRVTFHVVLFMITIVGIPWAIQRLVRWLFVQQAIMIDGTSAQEALSRSASAVDGSWWRTLGVWVVLSMLAGVPVAIATLLARAMPVVIGSTLSATMNALTLPFLVTAQTLFYFDLRARKESYDVSPA